DLCHVKVISPSTQSLVKSFVDIVQALLVGVVTSMIKCNLSQHHSMLCNFLPLGCCLRATHHVVSNIRQPIRLRQCGSTGAITTITHRLSGQIPCLVHVISTSIF